MASLEALFQRDYDLNEPEVCARPMLLRNFDPCSLKREWSTCRIQEHVRGRKSFPACALPLMGVGCWSGSRGISCPTASRTLDGGRLSGRAVGDLPCLAKAPRDVL